MGRGIVARAGDEDSSGGTRGQLAGGMVEVQVVDFQSQETSRLSRTAVPDDCDGNLRA